MKRCRLALWGLLLSIVTATSVWAQAFPTRHVRYILPFPAGSEGDVFVRVLAQKLSEAWGRPVVVDNRPGGGHVVATALAAQASSDGYTLFHAAGAHAVNPTLQKNLPYDTLKDFACVTHIGNTSAILVADPSLPANNIQELIALAKAQPRPILYGSSSVGTGNHILGESLRVAAGINMAYVPYKSGGMAITDVLAGRLQLAVSIVFEAVPHIRSGKVKPIAIMNPERSPSLPDVPTVGETFPAYKSGTTFWALLVPARTPDVLVKKLNADVLKAMQTADVRDRLAQLDVGVVGSTPAQCDAFLREQVAIWGELVKASGARAS